MRELDTISDFLQYLRDKEDLLTADDLRTIFEVGEEDLLGIYIDNDRSFPIGGTEWLVQEGFWEEVKNNPEYLKKREDDDFSKKVWDTIIEQISGYIINDELVCEMSSGTIPRFQRRLLSHAYSDAFNNADPHVITTRLGRSDSGVVYIFQFYPIDVPRDRRQSELSARCFLAKGLYPERSIIVGIATEIENKIGISFDLCYFEQEGWTDDDQEKFDKIQKETGFFSDTTTTEYHIDEYPSD